MRTFIATFANNSALKLTETQDRIISSCGASYLKPLNDSEAIHRVIKWIGLETGTFCVSWFEI